MNELEFRQYTDRLYRSVLNRLDREDPDVIEGELSAGVVKIRNAKGQIYVLNHQVPVSQIWYAAGDRAWHFERQADGRWVDPRHGDELAQILASTLSQLAGVTIAIDLPS
jgi:iron donor protein CyaY